MHSGQAASPPHINLVDPEPYSHGDPFVQWRRLRAHEPVYGHPPADLPGFRSLAGYEDGRTAYRDSEEFSSGGGILPHPAEHGAGPKGGRTLALTDPPRRRRPRGLAGKAAHAGDGLVSASATARIDGERLKADDVILNGETLLVGGTENTWTAAAGGMLSFLGHPGQWRVLPEDPALLPSGVEEVLSRASTAMPIMCTAVRPVEPHGRKTAAGDRVVFCLPSASRDETGFADPGRFDVRRQPDPHPALVFGEHCCPDNRLARVELRLLFGDLLRKSMDNELDGEPELLDPIVVNGPERLAVRLVSHAA